jgi:tetratricopeptide (TPR) repeat protein
MHYALYLLRKGEGEAALRCLDKAESLRPKLLLQKNITLSRASCHWIMGRIEQARDILEGMRAEYEYVNANVLITLGYMYFLLDDFEKARQLSQLAIEDTPDSGAAWDNLGQIFYKQGQRAQAKEAFEKAIEYKPDLPDSLYHLGCIAEDEANYNAAAAYFSRAAACSITALNTVTRKQIEVKNNHGRLSDE